MKLALTLLVVLFALFVGYQVIKSTSSRIRASHTAIAEITEAS